MKMRIAIFAGLAALMLQGCGQSSKAPAEPPAEEYTLEELDQAAGVAKVTNDYVDGGEVLADELYREKTREKSALLTAYEKAIEPIFQKEALVEVMVRCGIRGDGWAEHKRSELQAYLNSPEIEEMRARLDGQESAAAARFGELVREVGISFNIGTADLNKSCRMIAEMPFVQNEANFLP